jgi:hypothetical protein
MFIAFPNLTVEIIVNVSLKHFQDTFSKISLYNHIIQPVLKVRLMDGGNLMKEMRKKSNFRNVFNAH